MSPASGSCAVSVRKGASGARSWRTAARYSRSGKVGALSLRSATRTRTVVCRSRPPPSLAITGTSHSARRSRSSGTRVVSAPLFGSIANVSRSLADGME